MPSKPQDPWDDMAKEVEEELENLNTTRAAFTSRGGGNIAADSPVPKGGGGGGGGFQTPSGKSSNPRVILSVEADDLISVSDYVEELLDDMRMAVDMAINHPDKFSIPTSEIQRRQDLLRRWERRSEKARGDAKMVKQQREVLQSVGNNAPGGPVPNYSPATGDNGHTDFMNQEFAQQEEIKADQDQAVDRLREGTSRLKDKAEMIGDELKTHEQMLEDLDKDMSTVQVKLEGVAKKVGKLLDDTSDKNKIICIVVLLIILAMLIVFLFADDGSSN